MTQQQFIERYSFKPSQDEIGRGSFGAVYKAYDNTLDTVVAIKKSEMQMHGKKEFSLMQEFQAIKDVPNHPNLARYIEVHRFESMAGVFDYAIMQHYPLGNLSDYLKKHSLNFEKREVLVIAILDGISHLHKHKVVHRDLKPSNILLVEKDGELKPKITDFGLSKLINKNTKGSRVTSSFAGGTLQYSSPEQLVLQPLKLNTDLWSFGVIAFEILTGETLFADNGSSAASAKSESSITQQILHQDINPRLVDLPTEWQAVLKRCLVRDIDKRAQSADELKTLYKTTKENKNKPTKPNDNSTKIHDKDKPIEKEIKDQKPDENKPNQPNNDGTILRSENEIEIGEKGKEDEKWWKKIKPKQYLIMGIVILIAISLIGYMISNRNKEPIIDDTENNPIVNIDENDKLDDEKTKSKTDENNNKNELKAAENKAWQIAIDLNTIESYKAYITKYNNGIYATEAQSRITTIEIKERQRVEKAKEDTAWNTAKRKNTITAYNNYLNEYPSGRYASQAKSKIKDIRDTQNQPKVDMTEYNKHLKWAKGMIDVVGVDGCVSDETFSKQVPQALRAALKANPNGTEAKKLLKYFQ